MYLGTPQGCILLRVPSTNFVANIYNCCWLVTGEAGFFRKERRDLKVGEKSSSIEFCWQTWLVEAQHWVRVIFTCVSTIGALCSGSKRLTRRNIVHWSSTLSDAQNLLSFVLPPLPMPWLTVPVSSDAQKKQNKASWSAGTHSLKYYFMVLASEESIRWTAKEIIVYLT